MKTYWLNVTDDIDVIPLIHDVKLAIRESGVQDGMLTVYVPDGKGAVILAPEGIDKDREFKRWIRDWVTPKAKVKDEPPKKLYLSYLFGASQTLPLQKGEMLMNVHSSVYMVDFTEVATRREFRVSIFSESEKKPAIRRHCS